MSSPERSKKGRGRPRMEPSEATPSLRTQREKNRYAQSAFRARRRAAEAASEARINQLEGRIERMGDAFLTLVDHVIQSNQRRNDPELNERLHSSMQTFLTLAAASPDRTPAQSAVDDQGDSPRPTSYMNWNFGDNTGPRSTATLEGAGSGAGSSQHASALKPWTTDDSANIWNFLNQVDSTPSLFPRITGSPANVLGNGWTRDIPLPYMASLDQGVRPPAAQSLSNLIIQATLYYVYYILLEAGNTSPSDMASNIFRYALRLHSKEELLFNIRWFLGPGQREAYRLSKTGFQVLDNQAYNDVPTLSPTVDSDALNDVQAQEMSQLSIRQKLVNAEGVEAYLLRCGVRRISQDILEVDLEAPFNSYEARQRSGLATHSDLLNVDVFFPALSPGRSRGATTSVQSASATRTVRFSETSFMRFLVTQASHCLAYGPGYRVDRLRDLIEAAAIPT